MTAIRITGARVFDGRHFVDGPLCVSNGIIGTRGGDAVTLDGGILAPGFVDLQVNGGGGTMLNDAPTVESLRVIADAHARLGATTILPTLITAGREATRAAVDAVAAAVEAGVPGVAGLHLEGPHLAPTRKGAHDARHLRAMEADDFAFYLDAAARLPVLKITLAPEIVPPDRIAGLTEAGVLIALGHSDCTFEQAAAAADAGARFVTHLFNAMSQLGSRAPGLVGAAIADGRLSAGLIADLVHVHPASIRAALDAKTGPGGAYLVSDAMSVAGTGLDGFVLGGRHVRRVGGRLTLEDGTLAGADLDLATAVRNMVETVGLPVETALAMATSVPGGLIGRGGRLLPGAPADLVWLGDDLSLRGVWRAGVPLQPASESSA